MIRNPELQKYCWLELTPARLIVMPAVIAAAVVFCDLSTVGMAAFLRAASKAAAIGFAVLVGIWGAKLAAESVISEVTGRTWDTLRVTSLGPGELVAGKLFGSTLYAWYGGLLCALVMAGAAFYLPNPIDRLRSLAVLASAGIFAQAAALLLSLMAIRREGAAEQLSSTSVMVLGALPLIYALPFGLGPDAGRFRLQWLVWSLTVADFILISLVLFGAWAVVGCYRLMRAHLQMATGPGAWIGFTATLMIYAGGLTANLTGLAVADRVAISLQIAFGIGLVLTYLTAFAEPKDPVDLRRLIARLDRVGAGLAPSLPAALRGMPLWAVSFLVTLVLFGTSAGAVLLRESVSVCGRTGVGAVIYGITLLAFAVRDLSILLFCNLGETRRRADLAAAVYLGILYLLLPGLLMAGELDGAVPALLPLCDGRLVNGTVPVLIQAAVAIGAVTARWRSFQRRLAGEAA